MIWLFGAVHPTLASMRHCLKNDIPLLMLSQTGHWIGGLAYHHSKDPVVLVAQVNDTQHHQISRARYFVHQKINHQLNLLLRWQRLAKMPTEATLIQQIRHARNSLLEAENLEQLRGQEGVAARCYFAQLKAWVARSWCFNGRNRQPPRDPVNAMLSYGYSLLFHNIQSLMQVRGIDPLFGYLHQQRVAHPSLVLDWMEPWRAFVVDEIVMKIVLRQQLSVDDFHVSEQGCQLGKAARKQLITAFEQRMQQQFTHPVLNIKTDLRRFIDLQLLEFRRVITSGHGQLTPLRLR